MSDMKAMQIQETGTLEQLASPLHLVRVPIPTPGSKEVLLRVHTCGVCHTELDEIEGRTPPDALPRIPGHQVVGTIVACGEGVPPARCGERVGVAWIWSACGECQWCRKGEENLCPEFRGTGRDRDGGYAEYMVVPAAFALPLPDAIDDRAVAPLLCAGAIGWRSLRLAQLGPGDVLGLTGFGAANHLVLKVARRLHPGVEVIVWARNPDQRALALELGATWAGDTDEAPPRPPAAIIDTTPVWATVMAALEHLAPGGRLVINAIRKESVDRELLAELDYARQLWMEKEIKSVANVTRVDVADMLAFAARFDIRPEYQCYALEDASEALRDLRAGRIRGAKVLVMGGD